MNSELNKSKPELVNSIRMESIEHDMVFIENIISKYFDTPTEWLFVNGKREPLTSNKELDRYTDVVPIHKRPQHPLYTPNLISDYVDMIASDNNPYQSLIKDNTLIKDIDYKPYKIYSYPNNVISSPEELLSQYVPNMWRADFVAIMEYINIIYNKVIKAIMVNPSAIYDLNTKNVPVTLDVYADIKSFRFDEAHIINDKDHDDIVEYYDPNHNYGVDENSHTIREIRC